MNISITPTTEKRQDEESRAAVKNYKQVTQE